MANGSRHSLYLVPETVAGTTPTNPVFETLRITTTTLGLTKESLQSQENRSDRQIADFRLGSNQVAGDIGFELSYDTFDLLLEAALMGTWATDVLRPGVTRRSFTAMREFADLATGDKFFLYTGVEVNTLALTIAANAMITGTFSCMGRGMTTAASQPTGAVINPPTTTTPLDSFTGTITEGGTTIATVTELTLNLTNGLESRFVVGSKDSISPSVARSNLTGNVTAYFENSALVKKFINEESSSLAFTLPDADGNELEFTIPRLKYTGGQPDVSGEGPITLALPFQATLDPVTGTNLEIVRTPFI